MSRFVRFGMLAACCCLLSFAVFSKTPLANAQPAQRVLTLQEAVLGTVINPGEHTYMTCPEIGDATGFFRLRTPELEADQSAQYHVYEFTGNEPPTDGPFFISIGLYNVADVQTSQAYQNLVSTNGELITFNRDRLYYVYIHDNTPLKFKCGIGLDLEVQAVCGDGQVQPGEQCDDGNENAGDGCNQCQVEVGFVCPQNQCQRIVPTLPQ